MQNPELDALIFDQDPNDGQSFEFDFSTPNGHALQGDLSESEGQRTPRSSDHGSSSLPSYTLIWKLQLRRGRVTTLTQDTIENVDIAPGAYWNDNLMTELSSPVNENVPEPHFQPDETNITLSNSKRGVPPYTRRFPKQVIDWSDIESKLKSWNNLSGAIKVVISLIYKESQAPDKKAKAGRGATKKHLAALNSLITRQEAYGDRPVWKDVYQLMECTSASCMNRGFPCLREDDRHWKLDSDIMDRLVDHAEQGNPFETHADVPPGIRELIKIRKDEEDARKKRKRHGPDTQPISIRLCCHEHSSSQGQPALTVDFAEPDDMAPIIYAHWLSARVTNQHWRDATKLAGEVTVAKGYDLKWLHANQKEGQNMLVANGVLEGVAARFVSWGVQKWVDEITVD
ncbi:uncharacterized protein B0I36DRAFT_256765 [Microdochium trichocladiopsis]|uniref:Uncharacterized protein n=1 Tax=Microdochium trichocladiopsis TaxID=1682393 RepID=A0A9P9BFH3_9PEZI|nr:uncharacterized protein B0I36DRAFT_256765 [Microdochium trichocladiopsis]KAH7012135.1 hypothetical protein B0I36DRAFT_256765 [Microdochium trichocladiopsis]